MTLKSQISWFWINHKDDYPEWAWSNQVAPKKGLDSSWMDRLGAWEKFSSLWRVSSAVVEGAICGREQWVASGCWGPYGKKKLNSANNQGSCISGENIVLDNPLVSALWDLNKELGVLRLVCWPTDAVW